MRNVTTLRRLALSAIVAGVLAGALVALLGRDSPAATTPVGSVAGDLPRESGPMRTAVPGVRPPSAGTPSLPVVYPKIRGTGARVVATVADPYGGPAWAVRRFRRPDIQVRPGPRRVRVGTVDCVQVGRLLDGRFVWISPRARVAVDVPVGTTDDTVCGGAGRTGVVGGLRIPVGRAGASRPTIAATVLWGITQRAGARAALRSGVRSVGLPDLGGGVRLLVRKGDQPIGAGTLAVDGRNVRGGIDGLPTFEMNGRVRISNPPVAGGFRIDGVIADPAADRPKLLVTAPQGGSRCYGLTGSLVGGEPVRVATRLGALLPSTVACEVPPRMAGDGWMAVGGFAGSGGETPSADRRRATERRLLPGYTASVIAVPRRVVELDVQDGTGVRTVRTVPAGSVRLAVSLGGGDLPLLPIAAGFVTGLHRVYVGRDAAGRTVRLRPTRPVAP